MTSTHLRHSAHSSFFIRAFRKLSSSLAASSDSAHAAKANEAVLYSPTHSSTMVSTRSQKRRREAFAEPSPRKKLNAEKNKKKESSGPSEPRRRAQPHSQAPVSDRFPSQVRSLSFLAATRPSPFDGLGRQWVWPSLARREQLRRLECPIRAIFRRKASSERQRQPQCRRAHMLPSTAGSQRSTRLHAHGGPGG